MSTQNNGRNPARQPRRRRRAFYTNLSIERRAVVAAGMVRESGWTAQQAAGLCCVNPTYVGLARQVSDEDRLKLARGELRLARLWKDYRRDLAERQAKRLAAEREAQMKAEREEQARVIHACLDRVGLDRLMEQIVCRFGFEAPCEELDILSRRTSRDFVEIIIATLGSERAMRALDQLTAPQRITEEREVVP
jgi:hypothetical protein